jgi:flagellar biogenesis protein FliO
MIADAADSISWLRISLAFTFILALLAGLMFALKYAAGRGYRLPGMMVQNGRLKVMETLQLDVRRRLMLVRCDNAEYLLLLGADKDIVVASPLPKNQTTSLQPST